MPVRYAGNHESGGWHQGQQLGHNIVTQGPRSERRDETAAAAADSRRTRSGPHTTAYTAAAGETDRCVSSRSISTTASSPNIVAVMASTSGYRAEIGLWHCRQRPRSMIQPKIGTLSYQGIALPALRAVRRRIDQADPQRQPVHHHVQETADRRRRPRTARERSTRLSESRSGHRDG